MPIVDVTDATFDAEVAKQEGVVLVDFWAPWCGPCRKIAPMIDELADDNPTVKVCKLDIEEGQQVSMQYGIDRIPTVLVFKDGEVVQRFEGIPTKAKIQEALN